MAFTRAKPENAEKIRRFWKEAAAGPEGEGGCPVLLDSRAAKTPGGAPLALPSRALAALIAAEWATQGEHLEIGSMPLTRLAFTVIDHVSAQR
ncbi:MAG TPA: ATP12 family protein, partial [Caulobacteraceae bacterium]|nr:ATP12 family protein [Caulobacteraceae bacterium]